MPDDDAIYTCGQLYLDPNSYVSKVRENVFVIVHGYFHTIQLLSKTKAIYFYSKCINQNGYFNKETLF